MNTTAANTLNNIPSLALSATDVLRSLHDGLYFRKDSNIASFLKQQKFLEGILEAIKTEPGTVTEELYGIIRNLAKPENACLYLATNAEELIKHFGSGLPSLQTLFIASSEINTTNLSERFSEKAEHKYREG